MINYPLFWYSECSVLGWLQIKITFCWFPSSSLVTMVLTLCFVLGETGNL